MGIKRITRVNELLRREIADDFYRVLHDEGLDLSAITVTHVLTSPDLRSARVLISIRDHELERDAIMATIKRHRITLQERIGKNVTLKYTPRLIFELDPSIAIGDRVLDILGELNTTHPLPEHDEPAEEQNDL